MFTFLSRYSKTIAWFFTGILYVELLLASAEARAHYVRRETADVRRETTDVRREMTDVRSWPVLPLTAHVSRIDHKPGLPPTGDAGEQNYKPQTTNYKPETGGPGQPEMAAFSSVNNSNMVDLFSGDFSYNIPLLDVGGYPVNLGYRSGVSMDQEASWVGLGWNVNPGTINRNMRGLPDDFNGANDSVRKVTSIRENKTAGVNTGADLEIVGYPNKQGGGNDSMLSLNIGGSLGLFHNNYRGWGLECAFNASINAGMGSKGGLTAGLAMANNSQEGLTLTPSVTLKLNQMELGNKTLGNGSLSLALPYNTRSGLKALQLSAGLRQYSKDKDNQRYGAGSFSSYISFASPSYTPSITIPFTSKQYSFRVRVGIEQKVISPSWFISGYVSKQFIAPADTLLALPSYGYLYSQDGAQNRSALLDFNREKEIPYREKPAVAHIAVPSYTYDAFSITGEGTGGMFRAYRGDIGFVNDHYIRTKDHSEQLSLDVAIADLVHVGADLSLIRAFTQNGPWIEQNSMAQIVDFKRSAGAFEAVYFRNPGEKSINDRAFYDTLGGDNLVTVGLFQNGRSSAVLQATNQLIAYKDKKPVDTITLNARNAIKQQRDKRTQVISYLTAKEAETGALDKYIENYLYNQFDNITCTPPDFDQTAGNGAGLIGMYYPARDFKGTPTIRQDAAIDFFTTWSQSAPNGISAQPPPALFPADNFSIRWVGQVRAPQTGTYKFITQSDDGVRLWLNDTLVIDKWKNAPPFEDSCKVNLMQDQFYNLKIEFYEYKSPAGISLLWKRPGETDFAVVPSVCLFPPAIDTFNIGNYLVKEKRVNRFRKENHISEITVLNNDGRRYIYGIPVYNLKQKETTFNVNGKDSGDRESGLVKYTHGRDNSTLNMYGKERYYNSEEVPAYAHSFLLTSILSADYSDITGNGISDDDIGDAVRFNYSKLAGINNPYLWRAPAAADSATFNEGFKTDYRDDKGNYVYGEKELWYMHSIESKTMIATFVLEDRTDLYSVNERGQRVSNTVAKRLKEINLYSKADYMRLRSAARPVKTVHFEYDYTLCPGVNGPGTAKLTLKKVYFTYNGNKKRKENPYIFSYHNNNPSYNIKSYDRWGNYKDPLQNPGSAPGKVITNAEYPYALQDSATAAVNAAAWALDSIYLPSGGSIKVKYESDDYAYVQNKRAMQLFKILGFGTDANMPEKAQKLYTRKKAGNFEDRRYVFIRVPRPVANLQEVYEYYLKDIHKLYFRLHVKMPGDEYGDGYEYVPCYATLATSGGYGIVNANTIWVQMEGISLKGDGPGDYSPLAKATTQFLRLNLPSKAYPGSEIGDNLDLANAVRMLAAMADNITQMFSSFDRTARNQEWASEIDTVCSFVRLTNPYFKKYGGGHRVKRITIYDNWDKMTNQRAAMYGQEYSYTTEQEVNGDTVAISSGVASYEPGLGGEENPFHEPIEYVEKIAPLGPVTLGYTEEPLGESFFPAAGIGYSCVRVRTINYQKKKSANGLEETKFYTACDFPVYTDRTFIDDDTKKRFKPKLANFLRINAKHYIAISQGFKVELNDMHGKLRSKASYAETDLQHPIAYSENIYRVEEPRATAKKLSNTVMAIHPDGKIDTTALIGKDVELMMDMREQISITQGYNINLNLEMFTIPPPVPPIFMIPSFLNLAQREENRFRSVATTKIIQRYGILDSAIQIDKGSRISTKDILYDSETGDVLLTRTQNEFDDPVYNFNYPSHWAYDGMGLAYRNIDVTLSGIDMQDGRITAGLHDTLVNKLFSSGDEILVAGKLRTSDMTGCTDSFSTFRAYDKIWAVDRSLMRGGNKSIYFIDRAGRPYGGKGIVMKIIRSGRRNILASVGSVTSLDSLIRKNTGTGEYELVVNTGSKIIAASAAVFKDFWKVEDIKKKGRTDICLPRWRPTGKTRCVKDGNGNNTGYQEIQQKDINPRSSTFGDSLWVFFGLNCLECGRPASWQFTNNYRCEKDSLGNNTGYKEREKTDTVSCSPTTGASKWERYGPLRCDTCPTPARWIPTGAYWCQKNSDSIATGIRLQQQIDTASCSATYGTVRLVSVGYNCATCPRPAIWEATDSVYCLKNGNNKNTGYQVRQYKDVDICSITYGTTKLDTVQNCTACTMDSGWKFTGVDSCLRNGSGKKTGYQIRQQIDTAICSATYNTTRWTAAAINCTACAMDSGWKFTGVDSCLRNGSGKKTGYQIRQQIDTAICSATYNTTRWTMAAINCTACTMDSSWKVINSFCETTDPHPGAPLTGNLLVQKEDTAICSPTYGATRVDTVYQSPSCTCDTAACTAVPHQKCYKNRCVVSVQQCMYSYRRPGNKWMNCFRRVWPDSSFDGDIYCEEGLVRLCDTTGGGEASLKLPSGDQAMTLKKMEDKKMYFMTGWPDYDDKQDQFYRTVLSKEKYLQYRRQRAGIMAGKRSANETHAPNPLK